MNLNQFVFLSRVVRRTLTYPNQTPSDIVVYAERSKQRRTPSSAIAWPLLARMYYHALTKVLSHPTRPSFKEGTVAFSNSGVAVALVVSHAHLSSPDADQARIAFGSLKNAYAKHLSIVGDIMTDLEYHKLADTVLQASKLPVSSMLSREVDGIQASLGTLQDAPIDPSYLNLIGVSDSKKEITHVLKKLQLVLTSSQFIQQYSKLTSDSSSEWIFFLQSFRAVANPVSVNRSYVGYTHPPSSNPTTIRLPLLTDFSQTHTVKSDPITWMRSTSRVITNYYDMLAALKAGWTQRIDYSETTDPLGKIQYHRVVSIVPPSSAPKPVTMSQDEEPTSVQQTPLERLFSESLINPPQTQDEVNAVEHIAIEI